MNDRKEAIIRATKKSDCSGGQLKPIEALEGKKRGRPSLLAEDLTEDIKSYIYALREAGRCCQYLYSISSSYSYAPKEGSIFLT